MPSVRLPAMMKFYVNGQNEVFIPGVTLSELVENLVEQYPGLQPHLLDAQGNLRRYFNLFINGVHVRDLEGMQTPLQDQDRIILMASAAGGIFALTNRIS
ncbi:MAG: MoaD/ThiS family protein [Chloroflexi bacterium]|nr:MoaD/ThiS family protein [Chloroflexota bacterium]